MTMVRSPHRQPLALAVALALGVNLAQAATVTVASPGDTDIAATNTCTLRQAILTMNDGSYAGTNEGNCRTNAVTSPDDFGTNDVIVFDTSAVPSNSTITLNYALGLPALTVSGRLYYSLTIQGTGQTIDADHYSAVLVAQNDVGLTLSSLTLTNGSDIAGAGINALYTNLTLNDVAVVNNTASARGAGIYTIGRGDTTLTLNHSTVSNNTLNASLGNGNGAGVIAILTQVTLNQTTVSNNTLTEYTANIKHGSGGVYVNNSPTFIIGSTISGNSASGGDDAGFITGGVYAYDSQISITNSTISGNSVSCGFNAAGALSVSSGSANLTNSTVSGNAATATVPVHGSGGALVGSFSFYPTDLTLDNTILSGNSFDASSIDLDVISGLTASAHASLLGSALSGTSLGSANLYYDDPGLYGLSDNGGPTKTMALTISSPALNAGDTSLATDPATGYMLSFDQRGIGFPRTLAGQVDIGAFQHQPTDRIFDGGFESGP